MSGKPANGAPVEGAPENGKAAEGTAARAGGAAAGQPAAPLRRRPVQRRSVARVERILDAAAELLGTAGYGALTTREVARRAGVPIGTLYQFFPGKDGLVAALAARNLERYLARVAARVAAERPEAVAGLVDLAVDEFVAMKRAVPGFAVVDFGLVGPPPAVKHLHLLDAARENNAAVAARLGELVGGEQVSPLALRVALECADAVLQLAFRTDPGGDAALIEECKLLLKRYLVPSSAAPKGAD